jgi:hypothetical protein
MHSGDENRKHVSQRFIVSVLASEVPVGNALCIKLGTVRSPIGPPFSTSRSIHRQSRGYHSVQENQCRYARWNRDFRYCLMGLAVPKLNPEMQTADKCRLLWLVIQPENHKYDNWPCCHENQLHLLLFRDSYHCVQYLYSSSFITNQCAGHIWFVSRSPKQLHRPSTFEGCIVLQNMQFFSPINLVLLLGTFTVTEALTIPPNRFVIDI